MWQRGNNMSCGTAPVEKEINQLMASRNPIPNPLIRMTTLIFYLIGVFVKIYQRTRSREDRRISGVISLMQIHCPER
jgi:hypothetical protein